MNILAHISPITKTNKLTRCSLDKAELHCHVTCTWDLCKSYYIDPACGLLICVASKDYNKHQLVNNVLTTRPDHVFSKGCRLKHQCYTVSFEVFP